MRIAIFPGSFNPIHKGHLLVASYFSKLSLLELDEVWLMLSPHNPWKKETTLFPMEHRLKMVSLAVKNYDKLYCSDFETRLSVPSYTINTIHTLKEHYPTYTFDLIFGADTAQGLLQWEGGAYILENHRILVYPRPGFEVGEVMSEHPNVFFANKVETDKTSSTLIRSLMTQKQLPRQLIPKEVLKYLSAHQLGR